MKLVLRNGQTETELIPVFDRDEQDQSMKFKLGGTSVVLTKTSPSAVEVVVVHQLDQQPPPPPASEEEKPQQCVYGFMTCKETRNLLMIVATLLLQMAYQAGLNPPGGFWPDDLSAAAAQSSAMAASSLAPAPLGGENGGDAMVPHQAGDPILRSKHRSVYRLFEWLNWLSVVCSTMLILILITMSSVRSQDLSRRRLRTAMTIMYLDLLIILVAYNTIAVSVDKRIIWNIPCAVLLVAYVVQFRELGKWSATPQNVGKEGPQ